MTVWSYPAMLYLGLVAGVAAGNLAAHAAGVNAFPVFVATLILIIPALVGARLLYVSTHWTHYKNNRERIWNRHDGGLAMYGGLPVMLLLSVPVLFALRLEFGAFWDVAVLTILAAMIFTKIGCLMNGCCVGRPSTVWMSVVLPNPRGVWERRVPVQCLEAGWAAILLGFATAIRGSLPFSGALFLVVAAGYASGRLILESLREREQGASKITVGQAGSVATIVLSIGTFLLRWPR